MFALGLLLFYVVRQIETIATRKRNLDAGGISWEGGYPDCNRSPHEDLYNLDCYQRLTSKDTIKVACVGDSLTAGLEATSAQNTYPSKLQSMLDEEYGFGKFSVTNLGSSASVLSPTVKETWNKKDPYILRGQYRTFTSSKWDIIIIMLGTNDAYDKTVETGHDYWHHDCEHEGQIITSNCEYASNYQIMIEKARSLGASSQGPAIYLTIPPPLMGKYGGMNKTVINSIYPVLIPLIKDANDGVSGVIDAFAGLGGTPDWLSKFPSQCEANSEFAPCRWYCDNRNCDHCHLTDEGYEQLAETVYKGLKLDTFVALQRASALGEERKNNA